MEGGEIELGNDEKGCWRGGPRRGGKGAIENRSKILCKLQNKLIIWH